MHPKHLGFQVDWPVFVRRPFKTGKKAWEQGDHFPWADLKYDEVAVSHLYTNGYIHHNKELEKENKLGYRLEELSSSELRRVREQVNLVVQKRTTSKEEFNKIRCRGSASDNGQRGCIKRFLYNNPSFKDDYMQIVEDIISSRPKAVKNTEEA